MALDAPTPEPRRESSPDALFGAVLALEAMVAALLQEAATDQDGPALVRRMEARVAALLAGQPTATKFGTGAVDVADGARESLEAVLRMSGLAPSGRDGPERS